ncbi:ferritin-like domain-containing protein [Nannocystis punicea]|uniref:Ferritin-like domain-containing protein n=1 Tax=Nannocystis punicea TaxID=2995304 RepID=A0ABY7GTT3_9BACT|nr:ferritin-like domain-containing protein [Nannocystis poenicansa]WAS90367.1 ferritin-like domain-containing protein [Nannocystis poenicansa]
MPASLIVLRRRLLVALGLGASASCSEPATQSASPVHAREQAAPIASAREVCDPSFTFDPCTPEDYDGPLGEPLCRVDADCEDGKYGRCIVNDIGFGPGCVCDYSCRTDADCGSDEACICDHAFPDDHSRCVPALCRSDDDCPDGGCAFSSWYDGCSLVSFLACRGPQDTCQCDSDCDPDQTCAYDPDLGHWHCQYASCAIGRPLVVAGAARTAPAVARADWLTEIDLPRDLPADVQAAIAEHWADVAALEHASVASFAVVTLELMALGAPPELLAEAQRAALDEIEHARVAWSLASLWSGRPLGPGPLALDGFPLRHVLEDIVESLVRDGCVGETLGAAEAQLCAELAAHPVLAARLADIARDETRHAAFAWRTLRWLLASHGSAVRLVALTTVARLRAELAADLPPDDSLPSAPGWGLLRPRTRRAHHRDTFTAVIEPVLRTLLGPTALA